MANWNLPSLVSTYTNFLTELIARDNSCALWFNSATVSDTNIPTGTVRWNSTNSNWEKWSGAAWATLTTNSIYGINITGYATSIAGGNNTTLLGSIPYQSNTNTTTLLSPNVTTTKKFLTQTGTGTNGAAPTWTTLAVGDISGAAPLASPTFTGNPVLPTGTTGVTQTAGNNTTALATTEFVLANGTPLSSTNPLMNGSVAVGVGVTAARHDHVHPSDTSRAAVGQTFYIGTTQVAINRASASLNLTGINIDGSSGSCTGNAATATYATNATNQSGGTVNAIGGIRRNSTLVISDTVPTISSGFGTGASISSSNGSFAFRIYIGTSPGTTGVVTMPAAPTGWIVSIMGSGSSIWGGSFTKTASTTTSFTIAAWNTQTGGASTFQSGGYLDVIAFPY